jgi:L-methionine (R)-S-oxide reductase
VVPVSVGGAVVGVFDLDSPLLARFDDDDRTGLEAVVAAIAPAIDWERATRP